MIFMLFMLIWDLLLELNGIILGYEVMYYECDKLNKKNIYDNIKEWKYIIKDLYFYWCYWMYVVCKFSGGLGVYFDWVECRIEFGSKCGGRVLYCLGGLRKYMF